MQKPFIDMIHRKTKHTSAKSLTSVTSRASLTTSPAANAAASVSGTPLASAHSADSNSHTGLIAGLAVGLGLGAGLILAAAFFLIRSRKRKQQGAGHSDTNMAHHPGTAWPIKEVNELPTPTTTGVSSPHKDDPVPMHLRSELSDQSIPTLPQPPTYQHSYHEMSSENLASKPPQR